MKIKNILVLILILVVQKTEGSQNGNGKLIPPPPTTPPPVPAKIVNRKPSLMVYTDMASIPEISLSQAFMPQAPVPLTSMPLTPTISQIPAVSPIPVSPIPMQRPLSITVTSPQGTNVSTFSQPDSSVTDELMKFIDEDRYHFALAYIKHHFADINAPVQSYNGESPFYRAVKMGRFDMVQAMLDHGAQPLSANLLTGESPLELAKRLNHNDIYEFLLKRLTPEERQAALGQTIAAPKPHHKKAISLQFMPQDVTPLFARQRSDSNHGANHTTVDQAIEFNHTDNATALIKKLNVAEINRKNANGQTYLYRVVKNSNKALAKLLLDKGASPDLADSNGVTPLMIAAMDGNKDILNLLIQHKAKLDMQDRFGWTALMWSALRNQEDSALALIKAGAQTSLESFSPNAVSKILSVENAQKRSGRKMSDDEIDTEASKWGNKKFLTINENFAKNDVIRKTILDRYK